MVGAAKFRGQLASARLLGALLADAVRGAGEPRPDLLIPVPLHPRRLAERGLNQALEISRSLGRELGLAPDTSCCRRPVPTAPQTGLDERGRRRNVRGAFATVADLSGLSLAIVDDVVTTGSTVAELATVLRRAGAARIAVWAVARTP